MTTKAAFSPSEWQLLLEGPPTAGLLVITATRGGMFRETVAMSKAYRTEACFTAPVRGALPEPGRALNEVGR